MRILFITLCSIEMNSSAMIRNRALIKGLIMNGFSIDLLTISTQTKNSFYDETINWDKNVNIIKLNNDSVYTELVKEDKGIKGKIKKMIIPIARKIYHKLNVFDNTISIAKNVNVNVLKRNYYDLVISSSDPKTSHIAAGKLLKSGLKFGKWIQYWGDPLSIDITNKSIYPQFVLRRIEKRILSDADSIVYVSPFTYEKQVNAFPRHKSKMKFIPIPYFEKKEYENLLSETMLYSDLKLGYFGDYKTNVRDIRPLYSVCLNENIHLTIAGNSNISLKKSSKIKILPRVSQTEVDLLEKESHVLICILNKSGTQIPGKLYHYAGTNKPIIVIVDGEMKKELKIYLKKFNRFIICENNFDSIFNCIKSFNMNKNEYSPSIEFDPQNIAKELIKGNINVK